MRHVIRNPVLIKNLTTAIKPEIVPTELFPLFEIFGYDCFMMYDVL
jgi:hypothetical protein